jgi:hypothetical protein
LRRSSRGLRVLTKSEERLLVSLSLKAEDRQNLARIAEAVLDRDDRVTALIVAAGDTDRPEWRTASKQIDEVLHRDGGNPFGMLDLTVEVSQQLKVRRGEPRTWDWPKRRPVIWRDR